MALKRNERYPGRFSNPTTGQPQGAFKNRTAPGAQDGSYLEQDWANDWSGFFSSLLSAAGVTPNGNVDAVGASQYFDALKVALTGRIMGVRVFTTSGTYTPTAGTRMIVAELVGGGGGGGGTPATSANQGASAGGGGGGGYVKKLITSGFSGQSFVIGAFGLGATAGSVGGAAGGATTFMGMSAGGGGGGGVGGIFTASASLSGGGGGGGTATGGDINAQGEPGSGGFFYSNTLVQSGSGGGNPRYPFNFGPGRITNNDGIAASGYGCGGGGGNNGGAQASTRLGGNGSQGVLIITEYA